MKRVCMHGYISGRVQGVCFRQSTAQEAERLSLDGWVRNVPDGRVEVLLEGVEADVLALAEWLKRGPEKAEVSEVALVQQPLQGIAGFIVRR